MNHKIRDFEETDWLSVREIYAQGIKSGMATFETTVPEWEAWNQGHHPFCRYVSQIEDQIVGWLAISPISKRAAYRGVADISIYIDQNFQGQGIGKNLLQRLIKEAPTHGIWTLQSSIFEKNQKSIHLHTGLGFRIVGTREKIACLNGEWLNTVIMELRYPVN